MYLNDIYIKQTNKLCYESTSSAVRLNAATRDPERERPHRLRRDRFRRDAGGTSNRVRCGRLLVGRLAAVRFGLTPVEEILEGHEGSLVAVGGDAVGDGDGVGLDDAVSVVVGDVLDEELLSLGGRPAGKGRQDI